MKKVLVIDNYDSFTYNLVHLVHEVTGERPQVWRNDVFKLDAVAQFEYILLSPGPGLPSEAGLLEEVVKVYASVKKILGVCLGHQAIGEVFGAQLKNLSRVYHGKETPVKVIRPDHPLFENVQSPFAAGRYHSWVVNRETVPADLEVIAEDESGEIMALSHRTYKVWGVQFHPESVMTPAGKQIIHNWIYL
ncbi:MAG: aminodeoxychorismate/anthranilate synthase component II [Chitinophagales bacterium]|nr:MAG: aminodeoxychorismate/anthranilate synthase component II [Chitinophagales bacterium]